MAVCASSGAPLFSTCSRASGPSRTSAIRTGTSPLPWQEMGITPDTGLVDGAEFERLAERRRARPVQVHHVEHDLVEFHPFGQVGLFTRLGLCEEEEIPYAAPDLQRPPICTSAESVSSLTSVLVTLICAALDADAC